MKKNVLYCSCFLLLYFLFVCPGMFDDWNGKQAAKSCGRLHPDCESSPEVGARLYYGMKVSKYSL